MGLTTRAIRRHRANLREGLGGRTASTRVRGRYGCLWPPDLSCRGYLCPTIRRLWHVKDKAVVPWTLDGAQRMGGYVISWNHGRVNFVHSCSGRLAL